MSVLGAQIRFEMADKNIGQKESGIHDIDDDLIQGQAYQTTSTPKSCKQIDQRQNVNCIQQLRSTNNEPNFQFGAESMSEGQRSFDVQKPHFKNDRFQNGIESMSEDQRSFDRQFVSERFQREQTQDQQQLSKSFSVKPPKEKKSISTKTFAHGLMDVSLLTTHATQLRTVMSNKDHEFYDALMWMICLSIGLQVLSGFFLLTSDFFKTQDKMKDRQNQKKRKVLSFLSLVIVAVNKPLKILISAFYISNERPSQRHNLPSFAPSSFSFHNHTEL